MRAQGAVEEGAIWRAMADPTRRRILDLLRDGPRTTGEIAGAFDISRIAVMRHLSVLSETSLVISRKRGRERWHYINALPLVGIQERWVAPLQAGWARNLLRLRSHLGRPEVSTGALAIDISMEVDLAAGRREVFAALTRDVGAWWGPPFVTERATGLLLDARLGGSFSEVWGDGGKLLATITALDPGRLLELTGPFHLGVVYGVAAYRLDDSSAGTSLAFTHRGIGDVAPDVAEAFRGGWAELIGTRLRAFVERGERIEFDRRGKG